MSERDTERTQPGESLSGTSITWVVGIAVGLILQAATLILLVLTSQHTGLAAWLTDAVLALLVGATAMGVLAISAWRDVHAVRAVSSWSPNPWVWLLGCLFVPVLGPLVYLTRRRRHRSR